MDDASSLFPCWPCEQSSGRPLDLCGDVTAEKVSYKCWFCVTTWVVDWNNYFLEFVLHFLKVWLSTSKCQEMRHFSGQASCWNGAGFNQWSGLCWSAERNSENHMQQICCIRLIALNWLHQGQVIACIIISFAVFWPYFSLSV